MNKRTRISRSFRAGNNHAFIGGGSDINNLTFQRHTQLTHDPELSVNNRNGRLSTHLSGKILDLIKGTGQLCTQGRQLLELLLPGCLLKLEVQY